MVRGGDAHFAVVASQYNARYVDGMLRAAKAVLRRAGVKQIRIIRVPGAYEIPVVAARLARQTTSGEAQSGKDSPHPQSSVLASS